MTIQRTASDFEDASPFNAGLEDAPLVGGRAATLEDEAARFGDGFAEPGPADQDIGANGPPAELVGQDEIDAINDLALEAQHYLDGAAIKTQGEADDVAKLKRLIQAAGKAADEKRKALVEPFNVGKQAVQDRFNPALDRADRVSKAASKALAVWLQVLDAKKEAIALAARIEADRLAAIAAEAARAANPDNLAETEAAEALVADAKDAGQYARYAEKDKAKAKGGSGARAVSLQDRWAPTLTDNGLALQHYLQTRLADLDEVLLGWAKEDVRRGVRAIPGFDVINTPVAV